MGLNSPYLKKIPLIFPTSPFSNFVQHPRLPHPSLSPPTLTHTDHSALFYSMISWVYTSRALGPWCIFMQASSLLRFDTWCGFLLVPWFDITHTHTHTHTAHSGVSRMIDPYKYIFKPTVTCSQQLSLLQWMKNSMTSNIFFPYCLFFSKIMLIRCYKTRFFLWNTNNTDRNGVNKTHTHTRNTQRKITLERVS